MNLLRILLILAIATVAHAQELLFKDDFKGKLAEGWSWVRENPKAWRATDAGLEVLVEPGNMWGGQNNARNLLVRSVPSTTNTTIEAAVTVENTPTHQYEQVNLVWYYDDSNMVKIGQELVDGQLSIVMGREEKDQCRTVAIIPIKSSVVRVRFLARDGELRGQFRTPDSSAWSDAGSCSMPAPKGVPAQISLHFYQGPNDAEHWAKVTEFVVKRHD